MWLINPLSQLGRSQKIDMRFSRKDLWERPLSTGVNLHDIYRKPTRFLRMLYQGKQHQLELKWTTTTKRTKKAFWSAKLSREETGWYYCSAAYIWYHFIKKKKKKKITQEVEPQDKRVEPQIQTAELEGGPTVSRILNLIVFAWLDFEIIWDQWLSFCFLLSLFEMKCLSLL